MLRRRCVTADEQDIHTALRHKLILQPTYIRWVKRATNRRERREGRAQARGEFNS